MAAPAPARNTNTDQVEASAAVLDVLLPRLQERREAIQKEVLKYGEAPAGIKEVFELCRGFERAYVSFVNESPVASKIKESFMGDKGLAGMIRKQPIEKVYDLGNVKQMTRQADGYQPHLVSPEPGMRRLASEALDFVAGPVGATVQQVYTLLLNAAREAAEKAGQHTEAALMGALPMVVPDFKNVVMPAIVVALDEWKRDAEKMAMMLVDMERSYMTAGFFRHTMYHRANKIKQQLQMAQASQQANAQPGGGAGGGGSGKPAGRSFFPAFGASTKDSPPPPLPPGPAPSAPSQQGASTPAKAPPNADGASDASGEEPAEGASTPQQPPASGGAFNASDMTDPNSFLAGFFEKYNANDNAFLSIAGGLRWQKRFFIYSEAQRMLYYFKSAEDVSKGGQPRGTVNVSECVVEDLDAQGNVRTGGPPPSNTADKANLLLRVRHKDPRQMTLKDHTALILRADTYDQKTQWLSRLRRAADPPKRPPKPAGGDGQAGAEGQPGAQPFSSFGGSLSNTTPEDMSWAKDAEPIIDTHLGEGSSAFRADNVRDSDGRLLPAPQTVINPLRLSDKVRKLTGNAAADARHDTIMEQFGGDMCIYTRMICDTVITTVPKAIVHCMIRKSEKNLLERLFTVIHHLTPVQLEQLLREEDGVVNARREARAALEDTKQAIFVVQQVLERRNMASANDRPPNVTLPANCFAYAGMPELLTKEQREFYDQLFSSEHAPEAMKNWTVPPQLRALPPVLAAAAAKAVNAVRPAGAAPGQPARPGAPPGGTPLARPSTQPGAGGPPPPRPAAPGQVPPGQAPPVVRRAAPPPPPGGR